MIVADGDLVLTIEFCWCTFKIETGFLFIPIYIATAPDNEEKPNTADAVDLGPGSADCLALHKKGLYVAGQVW